MPTCEAKATAVLTVLTTVTGLDKEDLKRTDLLSRRPWDQFQDEFARKAKTGS